MCFWKTAPGYKVAEIEAKWINFINCYFHVIVCITRLSYYNFTTRLVVLDGLCWLKQNWVEKYVSLGFNCWFWLPFLVRVCLLGKTKFSLTNMLV